MPSVCVGKVDEGEGFPAIAIGLEATHRNTWMHAGRRGFRMLLRACRGLGLEVKIISYFGERSGLGGSYVTGELLKSTLFGSGEVELWSPTVGGGERKLA